MSDSFQIAYQENSTPKLTFSQQDSENEADLSLRNVIMTSRGGGEKKACSMITQCKIPFLKTLSHENGEPDYDTNSQNC